MVAAALDCHSAKHKSSAKVQVAGNNKQMNKQHKILLRKYVQVPLEHNVYT